MALIACPECSKEVSDLATSCPHCGTALKADNAETVVQSANASSPSHGSLIPPSILEKLPPLVARNVMRLPPDQQEQFLQEYSRKKKRPAVAYVLWFVLLHYFYLGKIGTGILFVLTLGGFGVWWLVDAYRTYKMVRSHNEAVATDILRHLPVIECPDCGHRAPDKARACPQCGRPMGEEAWALAIGVWLLGPFVAVPLWRSLRWPQWAKLAALAWSGIWCVAMMRANRRRTHASQASANRSKS